MYKVKIKDYEYKITETSNKKDKRLCYTDENNFAIGTCNVFKQEIVVLSTLSKTRFKKTLIHEITHAFLEAYGFKDNVFNEEEVSYFNECYIEQIMEIANAYMDYKNRKERKK